MTKKAALPIRLAVGIGIAVIAAPVLSQPNASLKWLADPFGAGPDQVPIRPLPVGQSIATRAGLEDAKGPVGMRMACFALPLESNRAYRITVRVDRASSGAWIADSCKDDAPILKDSGADTQADKLFSYRTHDIGNRAHFLRVNFFGRGKTYQATLELVASTPGELAAFDAEAIRAEQARLLARQQAELAKAQRGDSGLLGGLMMAAGVAAAGGNAQQIMGFGMKGAEMTTDNAYTRRALLGVGDQFVSDGMQTMARETAAANARVTAANAGRSGVRPAPAPAQRPLASAISPASRLPGASLAGAGTAGQVYLYCYQWSEQPNGKRSSNLSQIGGVPRSAPFPDITAQVTGRWETYLRSQGIPITPTTGCTLDVTAAGLEGGRASFIGTANYKGTLRQHSWTP